MAKLLKIKTKGFDTLQDTLRARFERGVMNPAQKSIVESSDDLAFVAQEMAPRKTGTLESAIEPITKPTRSGATISGGVRVRGTAYNPIDKKRVAQYRVEAHEEITPAGNKRLGPGSVQKNASILGKFDGVGVGGWFMTRALQYMQDKIINQLKDAIKRGLSRS